MIDYLYDLGRWSSKKKRPKMAEDSTTTFGANQARPSGERNNENQHSTTECDDENACCASSSRRDCAWCGATDFEPNKNYGLRIQLTSEPGDNVPVVVSTDSEKLFDNATSSIARHTFQQETWSSVWELNFKTPPTLTDPALIYLNFTVNNPVAHDYEYSRLGEYILNTLNY